MDGIQASIGCVQHVSRNPRLETTSCDVEMAPVMNGEENFVTCMEAVHPPNRYFNERRYGHFSDAWESIEDEYALFHRSIKQQAVKYHAEDSEAVATTFHSRERSRQRLYQLLLQKCMPSMMGGASSHLDAEAEGVRLILKSIPNFNA